MYKLFAILTTFLTINLFSVSFSYLNDTKEVSIVCDSIKENAERVEISIDSITGDTIYNWFMNVPVAKIIDKSFFNKLEKEMDKYVPNSEYLKNGKYFRLEALQIKAPYWLTDSVDFRKRCIISLTPSQIDWKNYYLVKTNKYVFFADKNLLGVFIEATEVKEELPCPEGANFLFELFNKHLSFFYEPSSKNFKRITIKDLKEFGNEYFEFDMKAR